MTLTGDSYLRMAQNLMRLAAEKRGGMIDINPLSNHYRRKPHEFLRLPATRQYMDALAVAVVVHRKSKAGESIVNEGLSLNKTGGGISLKQVLAARRSLVVTRKGRYGGTWMHPHLCVEFAGWLDQRLKPYIMLAMEDEFSRIPKPKTQDAHADAHL